MEYLVDVRATIDTLRVVGSSISDEEIIRYVVDGLDDTYRSLLAHSSSSIHNPRTTHAHEHNWSKLKKLPTHQQLRTRPGSLKWL